LKAKIIINPINGKLVSVMRSIGMHDKTCTQFPLAVLHIRICYRIGSDLVRLIKELGKYFGPEGEQPDKLLIVDYFSGTPPTDIIPYCDYIVQQAYSDQVGFLTQPSNFPPEKMIYCESFGVLHMQPSLHRPYSG